MQTYSTRGIPPERRLRYWSALASDGIAPMHIEAAYSSADFRGRLTTLDLGPLIVAQASSTAAVIHRRGDSGRRFRDREFVIETAPDNDFSFCTPHWERNIGVNDLLITDSHHAGVVSHSGCTVIAVRIPEELFYKYIPEGDDLVGLVIPGDRGAGAFASAMMRSLLPRQPQDFRASTGDHLSLALLHSIAAACAEAIGTRVPVAPGAEVRRREIIRFVEARLSDAELTVRHVAEAFGFSERYLRILYAECDESLSSYIRRRRLEESARDLRDPLFSSRTISDIAFRWGFNSLGSFDRAFRSQYSVTPGEWRAGATRARLSG